MGTNIRRSALVQVAILKCSWFLCGNFCFFAAFLKRFSGTKVEVVYRCRRQEISFSEEEQNFGWLFRRFFRDES